MSEENDWKHITGEKLSYESLQAKLEKAEAELLTEREKSKAFEARCERLEKALVRLAEFLGELTVSSHPESPTIVNEFITPALADGKE
jgi:hypothetical protein